MALILTEGFETYTNDLAPGVASGKWTSASGEWRDDGTRTGVKNFRNYSLRRTVAGADEHATFIGGFSQIYGYAIDTPLLSFNSDNNATTHVSLYRKSDGKVAIYVGATQVAITAAPALAGSTHTYLEMVATLADAGGQVDIYKNANPTPILSYTGDTKNGGTKTVFDTFVFAGASYQYVDDIYAATGAGAAPYNARLGDVKIYPLLPNGNGNYSQLVGSDGNSIDNYLLVDEHPNSRNDADYVGSATNAQKDSYTYQDLAAASGTILEVTRMTFAYKSDAGAKSMRNFSRVSGIDYVTADFALSTATVGTQEMLKVNPATGNPWTVGEINAVEFGVEVRA